MRIQYQNAKIFIIVIVFGILGIFPFVTKAASQADSGLLRNFLCSISSWWSDECIRAETGQRISSNNQAFGEIEKRALEFIKGEGSVVIVEKAVVKETAQKEEDAQGEQGMGGETGASGATGTQGRQGERGPEGPQGPAGTNGQDGSDGEDGEDGQDGEDGSDGQDASAIFGSSIDSSEITDGTLTFSDWASNSCTNEQIPKYNSTSGEWECGNDAGGTSYTAGAGLTLSGSAFGLDLDGSTLTVSASGLKIADTYDDNFALTNGSYANPSWITSLAGAKITGNISGNAGTVTNGLYTNTDFAGDVSGTYDAIILDNSGVSAGTYGNSGASVAQITIDSKGRITSASNRTLTKSDLSLGNVENTALSLWTGSTNITTLGTIGTGVWHGSDIALGTYTSGNYVASVTNGTGITGGSSGSEGAALTLSLNINGLTGTSTVASDDYIPMYDTSGSTTFKVSRSDFLSGVMGSLNYQGTWDNSATATPETCDASADGHYWVATVDASNGYSNKDWAICNGTSWEKLANSNGVTSVFGRTGVVTADSGDYTALKITNTAAGNIAATTVQAAINELDAEKLAIDGSITSLDVPDYAGNAGKILTVNGTANGVVWTSGLTASLASGNIYLGNSEGAAAAVSISGDATLGSTGVLTIGNDAITSAKIDDGVILNADISDSASIADGKLATIATANKVSGSAIQLGTNSGLEDSAGLMVNLDGTSLSLGASGLSLNVANANTWSGVQTFSNALIAPMTSNTINGLIINSGSLSSVGSISGSGALTLSAGGSNQNITLTPSGTGYTVLNGNVGIGTTNPQGALDINGGLFINGMQTFYNAQAVDGLTGSFFIGDGGGSLSHSAGIDAYYNTALGIGALYSHTTGYANTASGYYALNANTTGSLNTAIGRDALKVSTTGFSNTASGYGALINNTTGYGNTANGIYALGGITTGWFNTAAGASAGRYLSDSTTLNSGSNNSVYLGNLSLSGAADAANEIVIGAGALGLGSDSVVLGSDSILTTALKGNVGIGTTSPQAKLDVNGALKSGTISSTGIVTAATGFSATTGGVELADSEPDDTDDKLYNIGGVLYWNGSVIGGGGGTTTLQSISSSTTLAGWTRTAKVDASSGFVTITLPTAVGSSGQVIEVLKTDNSSNVVKIAANSSETINGSTNNIYLYSQNDSVVIRSDGTNSYIVADNRGSVGSTADRMVIGYSGSTGMWPVGGDAPIGTNAVVSSEGNTFSLSGNVITVKAGKRVRLTGPSTGVFDTGAGSNTHYWALSGQTSMYEPAGSVAVSGYVISPQATGSNTSSSPAVLEFTPTTDTDLVLYSSQSNSIFNLTADFGLITAEVVSTPQNVVNMIDYVYARPSASITTANTTIPVTTALQGNISISSNMFSLKAGKTYELEAFMDFAGVAGGGNRWAIYTWTDASGTQLPGSNLAIAVPPQSDATDSPMLAKAVITPTTDMSVKLMTTATVSNIGSLVTDRSYFRIVQIGSTASTGVALNSLINATANGSLDNQNYTQTWDWSTADNETGLSMTGNALTSGGLLSLATSSASATGSISSINISNASASAKGLSIANAGAGLSMDVQGAVAFKAGTTYTTAGSANDVNFGNASLIKLDTSGAAQTITGIAGGADGKILTLMNIDATNAVTLSNSSASSSDGNKILTGTGADLTLAANASVMLQYDSTGTAATSYWRVIGGTGGGGDIAGGMGVPDYTNGESRSTDTVYQASTDGYLSAVFYGAFMNDLYIYVGSTNPPTTVAWRQGDDQNNYTKWGSAMIPIKSGNYYKVTQGYDTVTAKFYPAIEGADQWTANGTALYYNGGNVGIGTTSPTEALVVTDATSNPALVVKNFNGKFVTMGTDATDGEFLMWDNASPLRFSTADTDDGGGWSEKMRITADGNVGIGTTNPALRFETEGGARIGSDDYYVYVGGSKLAKMIYNASQSRFYFMNNTGGMYLAADATSWSSNSDARLKQNITSLDESTLDKVMALNPVTFNWISGTGKEQVGFIAQEVEKVGLGDIVVAPENPDNCIPGSETANDCYGINYDKFAPYLVKAIQDQQGMIESNLDSFVALDLRTKNIVGIEDGSPDGEASKTIFRGTVVADTLKANRIEGLNFVSGSELSEVDAQLVAYGQTLNDISEQLAFLEAKITGEELSLKLEDLKVSGGVTFKSNVEFQGPAMFKKLAEFIDEVVFKNDVKFSGNVEMDKNLTLNFVTFNSDSAGYAIIKAGENKVDVKFEKEYATVPIITATLKSGVKIDWYRVTGESTKGFSIEIDPKKDRDIKFSWMAVAVKDVRTIESEGGSGSVEDDPGTGDLEDAADNVEENDAANDSNNEAESEIESEATQDDAAGVMTDTDNGESAEASSNL